MSYTVNNSLNLFWVTEKNVLTQIRNVELSDNDFNGLNGYDYLDEDARESGFKSNETYHLDRISKEAEFNTLKGIEKVKFAFTKYFEVLLKDDFYSEVDFKIEKSGSKFIVAVMIVTRH